MSNKQLGDALKAGHTKVVDGPQYKINEAGLFVSTGPDEGSKAARAVGDHKVRWETDVQSVRFHKLPPTKMYIDKSEVLVAGVMCTFSARLAGVPITQADINQGCALMLWEHSNRDSFTRNLTSYRAILESIFGVDVIGDRDLWNSSWEQPGKAVQF